MYLGLDLGTSALKAVLLAPDHRVVGQASVSLKISQPRPLWSEQDPADWEAAMFAVCDELAATHPAEMSRVRAIGLAGQMHGAVVLDSAHRPLRPAILWNDGRSHAECAALNAAVPDVPTITGNTAMPGFTAPKLLWLARHEPEIFTRIALVLLPKDFLRLRLSGEAISDVSDASGMFLLDIAARTWSPALLAACGLTASQLPRLVEGSAPATTLLPVLALRWGMSETVILAGGAGDNAACAIGMGITKPGNGFVSLGTSGVIFQVTAGFQPNPHACIHAFCHALPNTWHQMAVILSAASALRWVTQLTGSSDEAALLAQVAMLTPEDRASAPLFLPYLSGERTPHNDATATGAFIGLTHAHGAPALGYAVLEGVAFALRDGLLALGGGTPEGRFILVGGGTRSPLWCQLLADILGITLVFAEGGENAGALGAARLAWLASGGEVDDVCRQPAAQQTFVPARSDWAPRYASFRAAYPTLRGLV
ncbi:MAG TPA: xylulokinase [Acidocella sp.]|nr:MAG: xylulokinase [Acidocella sp. 20-61-6]HQT47652.1 xylulokinase [Acidocella sp.]